jgi:hypothetical protein
MRQFGLKKKLFISVRLDYLVYRLGYFMTTVNSATSTTANTTNVNALPSAQPQNTIMNLFESGWSDFGTYTNNYTTSAFTQPQAMPSTLNENPKNMASLLLENHYLQAYQAQMLSEASQTAVPQTAQTTVAQPQTTTDAASISTTQTGPTMQDMYNATQIANAISGQFGTNIPMLYQKNGLPTDFLLNGQMPSAAQAGLNFSA